MACKAAAIRGGTGSVASRGRSSDALSAITDGAGKVAKDIVETLIAKVGRETFQGIANRQRRAFERRAKRRSCTAWITKRRQGNEHDYLHIFFHPDSDR